MAAKTIYTSGAPAPNIPTNVSIAQFLAAHNPDDIDPEKVILCNFDDENQSVTFGGLRRLASQGAAGLRHVLGMKEGDTVCILAENSVNWALLAHSIVWGGGCFSAINVLATEYELVHYFEISNPSIIATTANNLAKVKKSLEISGKSKPWPNILIIEDGSSAPIVTKQKIFPQDLINDDTTPLPPYDLSKADARQIPAAMCFSSGTSGKPKGVLLSHYGIIAHLLATRSTDPFLNNGYHREVFFPSFAHIYGIIVAVMLNAFLGSYVVAMKRFDFRQYIERCATIRATILRMVPSTAVLLAKESWVQELDLKSVRCIISSGAVLQDKIVARLHEILGDTEIVQGYGMSEVSITSLRGHWGAVKGGSCGKPFAAVSLRVVNDDFNDVRPGTQGECIVKSPTLFMRYKNNRKETDSSFRDGWFCTGDMVRVDEQGFLWLTDRKKELIKYKGNQVPPAEIEGVLLSHPRVKDAAVCGVYDEDQQTEIPVGYVSIDNKPNEAAAMVRLLQDIKEYVDTRVAPYKRLRGGIFYLESIPKGPTGKVLRRMLPARLNADKEATKSKL